MKSGSSESNLLCVLCLFVAKIRSWQLELERQKMQKTTRIILVCGVFASLGMSSFAKSETKPAPAAQLMASAQKKAGKEHKNVFVMFHASWCGWCSRLEEVMDKPQFKKLFSDNYVMVSLDVSEHGEKKALENPGGDKVMTELGGANSGLPFYAIVDPKGAKLASSIAVPGPNGTQSNIGYPASPAEIAAFDALLKKTAPKMNVKARQNFIDYLRKNSPNH